MTINTHLSFLYFFFQPVLPRRLHSLALLELNQYTEKILVLHMIIEIKFMQQNLGSYALFPLLIVLINTKVTIIVTVINTVLMNLFNLNVKCINCSCLHPSIISEGQFIFCSGYKMKTWVIFIAYCLSAIFQKSPNRLRSSRSEVFLGKSVLIIWSQVTGKHPYQRCSATLLKSHFGMAWVLSCNAASGDLFRTLW